MMDIVSGCGNTLEDVVTKSRKETPGQSSKNRGFGEVLVRGG